MLLSAVGNLSNVGLDYLFIVRWDMGAGGAGLATALAQVLVCVVGGALLLNRVRDLWRRRTGLWRGGEWRALWALNRDLMLRTLLLLVTLATFTNLGSVLGTTVLAANAVLLKVQLLAAYLVDGLAYATEALAGILWGEGRRKDLRRLLTRALRWGVGVGVFVALLFSLFPAALYGLLTDHPEVMARLLRDTWWLVPVLTIGSAAYIFDGYFIGLTRGRTLYRSMLVSTLLGVFPFAAAAWVWESSDLLWAAMVAWICLRTLTLGMQVRATW